MAGPGIRYWEMARVLAQHHAVTLLAPRPIDLPASSFVVGDYQWGVAASLAKALADADAVVVNDHVLAGHPELSHIRQPLAIDLYDPILLENLELFREAGEARRVAQNQEDVELLRRQLGGGDFYLCATERQRDLYLGALMVAGRITPAATDADPGLRNLIDVVPFGLPADPPTKSRPVLRGGVPGIGADDLVLIWTGGLWDWLDPLTLIRAMAQVAPRETRARLVFLGGQHPGAALPMRMPAEARALAENLGLMNRSVFFVDRWIPYAERADFLLEADVAVSLHRNHLESAYAAVRSRFLDHLWVGLPSIVSDGDAAAELVSKHDLGIVVPPEDVEAVAKAIGDILNDPAELARYAARAKRLAADWTWPKVLNPLSRWLESKPQRTATGAENRTAQVTKASTQSGRVETREVAPPLESLMTLIHELEQQWHADQGATSGASSWRLTRRRFRDALRRIVMPRAHRQTLFNATLLHILYWMSDEVQATRAEHARLRQVVKELGGRVDDEETVSTLLAQQLSLLDPHRPQ